MPGFFRQIAAAPHRPLFLAGAFQTVATMAWWSLELLPRTGGPALLPPPALAAADAHAWLMLYGLLPFFVFGFLFTALPNWLETGPVARPRYLATGITLAAGATLFYPGLYLPGLAVAAVLLHLAGWGIGLAALARATAGSREPDRRHAHAVLATLALGWLGDAAFAAWLLLDEPILREAGIQLALWGCMTPLFLVVCHRMIPWFTSRIVERYVMIRPHGALAAMLAACLAHAGLATAGLPQWTWPADFTLAALAAWLVARWGIARAFPVRLLAMLYIGFLWAVLAFLLHGVDSLATLLWPGHGLGLAPLHALAMGFFGAMLIAMATRVSLGHSGRRLEADGFTWGLFWLVQLAALARLLPDLAQAPYGLVPMSGLLWLAVFALWSWRYAPFYWRARADGRPG